MLKHTGVPDVVRTDEQLIRDIVKKLIDEEGVARVHGHFHDRPVMSIPHPIDGAECLIRTSPFQLIEKPHYDFAEEDLILAQDLQEVLSRRGEF